MALYTPASLGRRDEHNSASYGLNEEEQEMIDLVHEFAEHLDPSLDTLEVIIGYIPYTLEEAADDI